MFASLNNYMIKKEKFDPDLQALAEFARVLSHPARLSILQYVASSKTCISGDISDQLPLSRTTVSQHLQELKRIGLIHGEINGLKVNYCICAEQMDRFLVMFEVFFKPIRENEFSCNSEKK